MGNSGGGEPRREGARLGYGAVGGVSTRGEIPGYADCNAAPPAVAFRSSPPHRGATHMDLENGQTYEMQGSGKNPYILKNVGGVYSCSCPAWRNQSLPPNARTCKHIRKLRGDAAEEAR